MVTPQPSVYQFDFTMADLSDFDSVLFFNTGAIQGDVFLDTIVLIADEVTMGDLNLDGYVDYSDLVLLSSEWMKQGQLQSDLSGDGRVDFTDYLILARNWSGMIVP